MKRIEMSRTMFTAQFEGFNVVVTCQVCQEKIGISNNTPKNQMDKLIVKFRKDHEAAHSGGVNGQ